MKRIQVIIERGEDGDLWGRIEGADFSPVTVGESNEEVVSNLKGLINDYLANEGSEDKQWNGVDLDKVKWDIAYDIQAFFEKFDYLKISSLADHAGINASLLRQYVSGHKYPSAAQVAKIEEAANKMGEELRHVRLAV